MTLDKETMDLVLDKDMAMEIHSDKIMVRAMDKMAKEILLMVMEVKEDRTMVKMAKIMVKEVISLDQVAKTKE